MSSFPDLLTSFEEAVEALKVKLSQDPNSSTNYNGEYLQSIVKDVEDQFAAIQAMVQGRLTYETKAAMDAAGAPPAGTVLAEVWRESIEGNNGLYGWTGSAWEKSSYDPRNEVRITGEYALVDPAGKIYDGQGINAGGNFVVSASFKSQSAWVASGQPIVIHLINGAVNDVGQYIVSFFSADGPDTTNQNLVGTSASFGSWKTDAEGNVYKVGVIPDGAEIMVWNHEFDGTPTNYFIAYDDAFRGVEPFKPNAIALDNYPLRDKITETLVKSYVSETVGQDNLYNKALNQTGYLNAGSPPTFNSNSDWQVATIPVEPGATYAVYTGEDDWVFPFLMAYGPAGQKVGDSMLSTVVLNSTSDPLVKTFTVPLDSQIEAVYCNVDIDPYGDPHDYTDTMIVQQGLYVPTRPLPFVPALEKIAGFKLKDSVARELIAQFDQKFHLSRFSKETIYCFGDSITQGTAGGYVDLVSGELNCTAVNYGSSGAATARLVGMMTNLPSRDGTTSADWDPNYTDVAAVTIMIGTNGGVSGTLADIPAKSVTDIPYDTVATLDDYLNSFPDTFYGNLGLCIEYVKEKNPQTEIYLVAPVQSDRDNFQNSEKVRDAMIEIAQHYAIGLINATDHCGVEKKQIMKYTSDGTHLVELGNQLLARYIARKLNVG